MGLIDWLRGILGKDDKVEEPPMAVGHGEPEMVRSSPPNIRADQKKKKFETTPQVADFSPDKAIKKLIEHEGFRLNPYVDSEGFMTGGIGHKFTEEDFKVFDTKWPREKKMKYWQDRFEEDLEKAEKNAIKIANKHGIETTPTNLYVLTDMSFNLGNAGVSKFKNFLTDLGQGDIDGAIKEMKYVSKDSEEPSKWYKQVPNRVESLAEILRSSNESS